MLLPSKFIEPDQALLTLSGQILLQLDQPMPIHDAWSKLNNWRKAMNMQSAIPFWWFALALDVAFSLGVVHFENNLLRKSVNATQS